MEYDKLYSAVLLITMVVLLTGVGVLLSDQMAETVREDTTTGEIGLTSTYKVITTTNTDLITITSIYNSTGVVVPAVNYSINSSKKNEIYLIGNWTGGSTTYNVTYTYDRETAATDSLQSGRDAITTVNTQWASIIILVLVMSVVVGLIISSFIMNRRR